MDDKKKQIAVNWGIYAFFLFLSVFSIYWVWLKGPTFFSGDDLAFHLGRIEGLAQSISAGQYLPRINYFITGGMGYPTGIFYPEIFLYPAAIFRVLGFSIVASYQCYLVLLNFITYIVAYKCFYFMNRTKWGAVLFSIFYGLSTYRMTDVLYRGAIGECLAFLFFPLIYVGIYQIIYGKKEKWWLLSIGMTGLLYSHSISALLAVMFLVMYCLASLRHLLKEKQRIKYLFYAAGITLLVTMDVYLPMLEQLLFQRLRVQEVSMFYLIKEAQSLGGYLTVAWANIGPNNVGVLIPLGLLVGLVCLKWESKENRRLLVIAGLFFILATNYFPHSLFHTTFFNSIQFPWRYFLIVTFLVSWVTADSIRKIPKKYTKSQLVISGLLVVLVIGYNIQNQHLLTTFKQVNYKGIEAIDGKDSLGYGKEFLPNEMESWASSTTLLFEPKDKIIVTNMSRSDDNAFYLQYDATESTRLIYPLLYYKGYVAEVNGKEQPVEDAGMYGETDMHGFVQVTVEGQGSVLVWYKGTMIQKISRFVSFVSLGLFLLYFIVKQRKKEKLKKTPSSTS